MRLSVPSWQKGGNQLPHASLVQPRSQIHQVLNPRFHAQQKQHQELKMIYHTQRGGSTAEPIPPVSGQVHPQGSASSFATPVTRYESTDWLCFVACRTALPGRLAMDYSSGRLG